MIVVLRNGLHKQNIKNYFLLGTMLLIGCVPSTIPISYDDLAKFKGESGGITIYVELRHKGNLILPGERYIVYVENQSDKTLIFDYTNDEYKYYTVSQVFRAHLFRVASVYPRWVKPGEVASIGILTDRKGLTISGFEVYFTDLDLKVFAGPKEKIN